MSDEDDYMSDKFLAMSVPTSGPILPPDDDFEGRSAISRFSMPSCPSLRRIMIIGILSEHLIKPKSAIRAALIKRGQDARSYQIYKKKIKTLKPKKSVIEKEVREVGLNTAISNENKGFKMLAKMGYKPGTSLGKSNDGILEPINVTINPNKMGVGAASGKIEKEALSVEKLKELEINFKKTAGNKRQFRKLRKYYLKAQKACENLDNDGGVKTPIEDYYWSKEVMDLINPPQLDEDEEPEEEILSDNEMLEKLNNITHYIRTKYLYCLFCGSKALDENDFKSFCPGPFMEDHDLEH